jgi:hypothetical protein
LICMKSHLAEISNSSTEAPSPLTGGKKWNAPVARKVSGPEPARR